METRIDLSAVVTTGAVIATEIFAFANSTTYIPLPSMQNSTGTSSKFNMAEVNTISTSKTEEKERLALKIDLLAKTVKPTPRSKNSWLNTVGKYPEDSPLNRILDAGARIRESERNQP